MRPLTTANKQSIDTLPLLRTLSLTTALVVVANPILACGFFPPPEPPPPPVWIINHPGTNDIWIGVELGGLVPPITAPTQCACGSTILPGGIALPSSFDITDALVTISPADNSSMGTELVDGSGNPIFDFISDEDAGTNIGSTLAQDPWAVPNQTWNGFGATVNPFNIPILGPDQIFKLWFKATVDQPDLDAALNALAQNPNRFQFASGTFDNSNHPITYTGPTVPEPSATISLFGLAGLMLFSRRRKTLNQEQEA